MRVFIEGTILPIVGTFGIFANTAGILYFVKQRRHQQRFYGLMVVLAIVDSLLIFSCFCTFSLPLLLNSTKRHMEWYYIIWMIPVSQIFYTSNIYITGALSVDRYLSICKPLYYYAHPWPKRFIVVPILCFSALYNIPRFFEFEWSTQMVNGTNITVVGATEMRLNTYYVQVYFLWCTLIVHGILPFFVLVTLNILTLKEMRKYKGKANGDQQEEQKRRVQVHMAELNIIIVLISIFCCSIRYIPTICELMWVSCI